MNSDVTIEILKNLQGKDILSLSKTCKKLREICFKERYEKIWIEKLSEEYSFSFKKDIFTPYEKYLEMTNMHQRIFYRLDYATSMGDHSDRSYVFASKDLAIEYATYLISTKEPKVNYYQVRSTIEDNLFENETGDFYSIATMKLNISPKKFPKEKAKYELVLNEVKKEFPNQNKYFYVHLKDLVYYGSNEEQLNEFIEMFDVYPKEKILKFLERKDLFPL